MKVEDGLGNNFFDIKILDWEKIEKGMIDRSDDELTDSDDEGLVEMQESKVIFNEVVDSSDFEVSIVELPLDQSQNSFKGLVEVAQNRIKDVVLKGKEFKESETGKKWWENTKVMFGL